MSPRSKCVNLVAPRHKINWLVGLSMLAKVPFQQIEAVTPQPCPNNLHMSIAKVTLLHAPSSACKSSARRSSARKSSAGRSSVHCSSGDAPLRVAPLHAAPSTSVRSSPYVLIFFASCFSPLCFAPLHRWHSFATIVVANRCLQQLSNLGVETRIFYLHLCVLMSIPTTASKKMNVV
ncbi:hypothetical protein S83_065586 [Arachis hypogaea]